MASRPFAFGARFRDKGRTLKVRVLDPSTGRYAVEDRSREGKLRRREHDSLADAVRDFAHTWRCRLH